LINIPIKRTKILQNFQNIEKISIVSFILVMISVFAPRLPRIAQMLGGCEEARADSTRKYGKRAPGAPTTQMGYYGRPC
jgi:hypothetical protein